jgi:hypothetical protein
MQRPPNLGLDTQVILVDIMETTISSEVYVGILQKFKDRIQGNRPQRKMEDDLICIITHERTPVCEQGNHKKLRRSVLLHPPHDTDLAPSDFHFLIHRKVLYAEESFVLTTFAEV